MESNLGGMDCCRQWAGERELMVTLKGDAGGCGATGMARAEDMRNRRWGLCCSCQQEPGEQLGWGHRAGVALLVTSSKRQKCQRQDGCRVLGMPVLGTYL